jgi:hypothetical protein
MPIAMPPSRADKRRGRSRNTQMPKVTPMAKTPDRKTEGSISPERPQRSATVKTAKPNAEPSAARLPFRTTLPDLSATMMAMPAIATAMAIHVATRTGSRRTSQPRTAAMNGAVAKSSIAFATEVTWIE